MYFVYPKKLGNYFVAAAKTCKPALKQVLERWEKKKLNLTEKRKSKDLNKSKSKYNTIWQRTSGVVVWGRKDFLYGSILLLIFLVKDYDDDEMRNTLFILHLGNNDDNDNNMWIICVDDFLPSKFPVFYECLTLWDLEVLLGVMGEELKVPHWVFSLIFRTLCNQMIHWWITNTWFHNDATLLYHCSNFFSLAQ